MPLHMPHRGYLVYSHDIVLTVLSFYISLPASGRWAFAYFSTETLIVGGALLAQLLQEYTVSDLYRGVWRYAP